MYPYDQGFGGYPQMGFGGYPLPGAGPQQGWGNMQGGFGQYQPQQMQGADQGNARIDKLKGRVSNLQEQMKGAGTEDMAGIQARMDKMQGRIKGLRQDRRQGEGMYGQPAGQQGGAQPEPGMVRDIRGNLVQGGRGGPVQLPNDIGGQFAGSQAQGPQDYWTADRMRNAKPMPMPMMPGGGNLSYGGQMGGAAPWGGGMNFGGMQGGGMYGGGMGGMGEGAFRGGYNPNQQGGGYSGDYQSQVGQYQQRLAQYQQQAAANGGNGGYAGPPAPPMGMYDNNGNLTQGANRPGMQYRQDRRQARQGEAAPNPESGMGPVGGGGGMPNWANTPLYSGTNYKTKFGDLVTSSTGNNNVFKVNGGSDQDLYHYDPKINDWKHMTADEYRGYGDYQYADPSQYAAKAGGVNVNPLAAAGGPWKGPSGGLKPNTSGIGSYG